MAVFILDHFNLHLSSPMWLWAIGLDSVGLEARGWGGSGIWGWGYIKTGS